MLPDLDRGRAFGEPPRGGQGSAIGDAEDAVAGNDVVGCVKLIEAILGHRALLLREKRLAGAAGCAVSSVAMVCEFVADLVLADQ